MSTTAPPVTGTLQPPPGALAATDKTPPLFCMFTEDWLTLQTYIASTLKLPITHSGFVDLYGTFTDEGEIDAVVAAMTAVQGLATTFGDPTALMKELASDPSILEATTAPTQLYTNIVWTAYQIYDAATTFTQTLGQFITLLNPANCGSPQQCGAAMVEILTGPGGLQSTAKSAETTLNALIEELASFAGEMKAPNDTMQTYTTNSGQFYKDAVTAGGQDASDVISFGEDADNAYTAWRDYTIEAVTVSVGLIVVSGGLFLPGAAIAAGVLGHNAVEARESYNTYCQERADSAADEQKKQQLVSDLGTLNTSVVLVNTAATNFITTLTQVAAAWAQIGQDLAYIVTTYTPEQLSDYSWLNQALKCDLATQDWQVIATAASAYTANSLVPFDMSVPFGTPVPTPTS